MRVVMYFGSSASSSELGAGSNSYAGSSGVPESLSTYSISIGATRRTTGFWVIIDSKCVDTRWISSMPELPSSS